MQKLKKFIYILLTMILLMEIGFLTILVAIEYMHINYAIMFGITLISTIGGFGLGQYWWRLVYIEKKHWCYKYFRKK